MGDDIFEPTPSEFEQLVEGMVLRDRLMKQRLDEDLEWIVPVGTFAGYTMAWGLPVRHIDGIDAPYLAHRIKIRTKELPL